MSDRIDCPNCGKFEASDWYCSKCFKQARKEGAKQAKIEILNRIVEIRDRIANKTNDNISKELDKFWKGMDYSKCLLNDLIRKAGDELDNEEKEEMLRQNKV